MDFVTISRHSSVNADSAPESLSQHNASVRSPIRYAKLGASLHHVYQQAKAISDLRDCDCQNTHLSKLPPEDLKARGDLLPLMGSSVILEYQGATGDAASIHEVGRMVQGYGIRRGIMGSKDQPMITQKNLHCTVGSLVLDYTEIEEVLLQLETLNNTSAEINEILSSDDVMNLKLRFTEWKFNANDGNFGFQFDCCESQNHQMHKDDLLQMIRNSPANLDDEVDFPLIFEQLKAQNQYDEKTGMLTLTRLQKIRIDLKVAGAQIKSIWRGTFMVLGWTQFATALQNHPNRHDFLINTERLTKPHISKTHTIPELTESFYEARTMNRPHCIVNGRVGNKVTVLPFDIARV